ncbi:MAG: tetratricopeptide repeat protein [Methylococcales bacterium]|nr:tetratricopeptide repeat protein [Methylococcales bacterium]
MTIIPSQLKESLQNGFAIPFIGAGVSMSVQNTAGGHLFPSWKTLLEQAATRLEDDGKSDDANIVKIFVKQNRFLEAATEAQRALNSNWYSFLKKQFALSSTDAEPVSLELAKRVWQLGADLVITTNYDHILRWACPRSHDLAQWDIEAPAEQHDLLCKGVNKPTILHLHGQIDNAAEIILTPDSYSKLYSEDKSEQKYQAALHTLQHQLSSRTFIFIGFSLADEAFVGHIKLLEEIFHGAAGTHYVLLPAFQRATFKPPVPCIEAIYFENFGAPQLALLDKLARFAKTVTVPAIAVSTDEVGDYSPDKSVFFVPFASKGKQMIGREDVLKKVHQQLWSGKRTSIGQTASFQGLGGLGKTQLAVEYAHTYQSEYPNGVIWIHADQDIFAQLVHLAEQARWVSPLSDHAFKLTTAIKRLREVADCLIIFDNLEDQKDIEEILPATHVRSHILVTSRYEQDGFPPIDLDTLTPELGLQLLLQEAERHPHNEDETQAAADIVQLLDGLPLALELAGAYLRRRTSISWQQYLELLQDNLQAAFPSSLHKHSLTRHEADIYATLRIHETLFTEEPLLKDILDVLTWSGSATMSVSLLLALLAQDKASSLTGALSLGCALRILQRSNDGEAYAIHRLVREVRRVELPLIERTDWVKTCAQRLDDWFEKHRQDFSDLPLFEANLNHLQTWQQQAQALKFLLLAARLVWLQAYPAWHWGRYKEAKQYMEQAQDLYAQAATQDFALKAHLLNDLGSVASALGDYKTALALGEEALKLRSELFGEEHSDTAMSLSNVADYYDSLGNTVKALELGEQALQIYRKLLGEDHPYTAISLNNVANYYRTLGNKTKALELGKQALQIRHKLLGEKHPATAYSLNNVASYYDSLGNSTKALYLGEQAWQILRKSLGEEHPTTVLSNCNVIGYLQDNNQRSVAFERLEHQLTLLKKDHPHYEKLTRLRERLLSKPIRNGFRQPPKNTHKSKTKKRREFDQQNYKTYLR